VERPRLERNRLASNPNRTRWEREIRSVLTFLRRVNALLDKLAGRIKALKPGESEDAIRIKVVQMMSAVILPALMPRAFRPLIRTSFEDPATRRSYIASLIAALFD